MHEYATLWLIPIKYPLHLWNYYLIFISNSPSFSLKFLKLINIFHPPTFFIFALYFTPINLYNIILFYFYGSLYCSTSPLNSLFIFSTFIFLFCCHCLLTISPVCHYLFSILSYYDILFAQTETMRRRERKKIKIEENRRETIKGKEINDNWY